MKDHHLYADEKGYSHFEDMDIEYIERRRAVHAALANNGNDLPRSSAHL